MNPLQHIEQTYNFQYPKLYHQLYEDGMLDVRWQKERWWEEVFPELKKNPPLLLFRDQFMGLDDPEEIVNLIEDYKSQRGIKAEYLLVPFASECEGDICFFYHREKPELPPVIVKDWYDFNSAEIIADNLQNFIFYGLLQLVHTIYPNVPILLGDFYENIANIYHTHHPYLNEEQTQVIKEIYNRKLTNFPCSAKKEENRYSPYLIAKHRSDYTALLSDEEYFDLLNKYNPISTPEDDRDFFIS